MRHKSELLKIADKQCTVLTESDGQQAPQTETKKVDCVLLIQPTDSHDREGLTTEVEYIEEHSPAAFTLVAVHVEKWFDELAPWQAPPVFGKTPFGDGAADTLHYIVGELLPYMNEHFGPFTKVILGGYSLAGLFSLWAGCQHAFDGIVAASPSVWYNDWTDYARQHPSQSRRVYLSLGDRETHTKTKIMATVGERLQEEKEILESQGVATTLVMNPGNHFQDNDIRTAKGFVWCIG